MSYLAISFVLIFDLVLVAGFWVFHEQLRHRFYKRCNLAFTVETLATLSLLCFEWDLVRPFAYTLVFSLLSVKGLVLWSAIRSLDSPVTHKFWVLVVFIGYWVLIVGMAEAGLSSQWVTQTAILIPLAFQLAPAWALYRSHWIGWKAYQLFLGCLLFSCVLFAFATQMGGVNEEYSVMLYFLFTISNIFVGLSGLVIGTKRLQKQLQTALDTISSIRNQTEAIVKASMDSILITDLEGGICFANPVARKLFIDDDEDKPNLFQHSFQSEEPGHPPFDSGLIKRNLIDRGNAFIRWRCLMSHQALGEMPIELTAIPIENGGEDEHLIAFYIRDLREQHRNEAELIREKERAEALNVRLSQALEEARAMTDKAEHANAAKNEFLGVMSHELRTPLSAIIGMATMMEQEPLTQTQRHSLGAITDCGQSLLMIIGDILNYSRIEAGRIHVENRPFRPAHTVEQVLSLMRPQCNRTSIRILPILDEHLPATVVGDEGKFRQVLTNLTSNALKFTNEGFVKILLRPSFSAQSGDWELELQVIDSGIGIERAQQDRLFEAFYQADCSPSRKYQGIGLGLAISKRLVTAMNGTIEVESEPQKGSTFCLRIPFVPIRKTTLGADLKRPIQPDRWRIIYVDPNPTARDWMVENLRQYQIEGRCLADWKDLDDINPDYLDGAGVLWVFDQDALQGDFASVLSTLPGKQAGAPHRIACAYHDLISVVEQFEHMLPKPFLFEQLFELMDSPLKSLGQGDDNGVSKAETLAPERPDPLPSLDLNVLVAEDHPINSKLAKLYLAKLGCDSVVASDGSKALKALENDRFDVVLMDLHMPGMDGFEATAKIRQVYDEAVRPKIIALTAGTSENERKRALECGMDHFLQKPVRIEQLRDALLLCCRPPSEENSRCEDPQENASTREHAS